VEVSSENSNAILGSKSGEPYIHQLSDGQLHIKDSTFHKHGELVIIF